MGCIDNISHDRFPEQSKHLGKNVEVVFHYSTKVRIMGTIVRDDNEKPYVTIFRLVDGRHVLATECQYRIP